MSVSKKVTNKAAATTKPAAATRQRGKVDAPADTPSRTEGSEAVGDKVVLDKTPEEPAAANVKASTAARALAASRNFDLSTVKGTGGGGVITKSDVQNALDKDVANYEESIAPVPGTMGLLQESQVDAGPDYGAIGGVEEVDRLAQLQAILDEANRGGTGGEMIRKLSEYQKSQPSAPAAPPAMDMSRLGTPAPTAEAAPGLSPAMQQSMFGRPAPASPAPDALSADDMDALIGPAPVMQPSPPVEFRLGDSWEPPAKSPSGILAGLSVDDLAYGPGNSAPVYEAPIPPRDVHSDLGEFGQGQTPPADNSEKFLASRGLSGLASDAWEYAKKHPGRVFLGGTALLGGGSLAMANLRGGGGTAPTAEEMDALARERDEARARAAQGYQQRNAAPLTMPQ